MSRLAPISQTETILNYVKARLEEMLDSENADRFAQVEKFPGSSTTALLDFLPNLSMPAAAIVYNGSDVANHPLRKLYLSVAIVTAISQSCDFEDLRAHIDAVTLKLDELMDGSVKYEVTGDKTLDMPDNPSLAAAFVNLEIKDH